MRPWQSGQSGALRRPALRVLAASGLGADADGLPAAALRLVLTYRPPLHWAALLRFLAARAVDGVEAVQATPGGGSYRRSLAFPAADGRRRLAQACRDIVKKNGLTAAYLRPVAYRGLGGFGLSADTPIDVAVATWPRQGDRA